MAEDTEVNLPHYGLNAAKPTRKAFAKKTKTFAKKTGSFAKKESNIGIYATIGGIITGMFVFAKKN
jgi:hypothetical protein